MDLNLPQITKHAFFSYKFLSKQKKYSFGLLFPFVYFEFMKNANHTTTLNFGIIHLDLQE